MRDNMTDYDDTFTPELCTTELMDETIETFNPELTSERVIEPSDEFNPLIYEANYGPPAPSSNSAKRVIWWQ